MTALIALFRRQAGRAWSGTGGAFATAGFFLAAAALSAFAIGPDREALTLAAPGVLTVCFTLAAVIGFEHFFQDDLQSGAADLLAMGPAPLEGVAAITILARACGALWPAALVAPAAAALLNAPSDMLAWTLPTLLVAAPGLAGAGAVAAALAAGAPRGGLLIAVITPPLLAGPAVLAALTLKAAAFGHTAGGMLALLAASSILLSVIGAFGAAAALRLHLE